MQIFKQVDEGICSQESFKQTGTTHCLDSNIEPADLFTKLELG